MIEISTPIITSEPRFDNWMGFTDAFINAMCGLHITVNDEPHYIVTTSDTFINDYHLESIVLLIPSTSQPSYGFRYGVGQYETYDGAVIGISALFLNPNIFLLSTNRLVDNSVHNGFGFGTVDIANAHSYGFSPKTSQLNLNALSYISDQTTDMRIATIHTYCNNDTAFISIYDSTNYIIFTRLKPISQEDEPLYAIITRIQNHPDKAIYIITKDQYEADTPFMEPLSIISSDLHIADKTSNDITINKFVFNNRWYSDDLYVVNYVNADNITILGGSQYVPLGFNLFLRAK